MTITNIFSINITTFIPIEKEKVMERKVMNLVVLPEEEWNLFKSNQKEILTLLKEGRSNPKANTISVGHITAKEFMAAVHIKRTKFDQLVASSKIKIIKKRHKIYLPVSEIDRYFKDSTIP